jgi:hypothetical protein
MTDIDTDYPHDDNTDVDYPHEHISLLRSPHDATESFCCGGCFSGCIIT